MADSGQLLATVSAHATLGAGYLKVTVQNRASAPLIAYVFTADGNPNGSWMICYEDAAQKFLWKPVAPGASFSPRGSFYNQPRVVFRAALWADGSSFGEPDWIEKLKLRAPFARKQLDIAISLLQEVKESGFNDAFLAKVRVALSQARSEENFDNLTSADSFFQYILELANGKIKRRPHEDGSLPTDAEVIRSAIGHFQKWRDGLSVYP